jgi:hypothetical protein
MRVQIDESGRNHESGGINLDLAANGAVGNRDNRLAIDSDVTDCIKTRRRIARGPVVTRRRRFAPPAATVLSRAGNASIHFTIQDPVSAAV